MPHLIIVNQPIPISIGAFQKVHSPCNRRPDSPQKGRIPGSLNIPPGQNYKQRRGIGSIVVHHPVGGKFMKHLTRLVLITDKQLQLIPQVGGIPIGNQGQRCPGGIAAKIPGIPGASTYRMSPIPAPRGGAKPGHHSAPYSRRSHVKPIQCHQRPLIPLIEAFIRRFKLNAGTEQGIVVRAVVPVNLLGIGQHGPIHPIGLSEGLAPGGHGNVDGKFVFGI